MLRVNGAAIAARGANMVPMEVLEGRIAPGQHRALVASAAAASFNTMRELMLSPALLRSSRIPQPTARNLLAAAQKPVLTAADGSRSAPHALLQHKSLS